MTMVKCKECKKDVSLSAKACPHCGATNPGINNEKFILFMLVVVALVIAFNFSFCSSKRDIVATGVVITAEEYGDDWPFSVDSGRLYCDPPGSTVVFESDGVVYALNGRAMGKAKERGYVDERDTLYLRDSSGYFTIGNSSKIIRRGLDMCNAANR